MYTFCRIYNSFLELSLLYTFSNETQIVVCFTYILWYNCIQLMKLKLHLFQAENVYMGCDASDVNKKLKFLYS